MAVALTEAMKMTIDEVRAIHEEQEATRCFWKVTQLTRNDMLSLRLASAPFKTLQSLSYGVQW